MFAINDLKRTFWCAVVAVVVLGSPQLAQAAPVITSLNPTSVASGGAGFQLTINGNGFSLNDTVQVNGVFRGAIFPQLGNPTIIAVAIQPGDIAVAGTVSIAVFDSTVPALSNTAFLTVTGPPVSGALPVLNSVTPPILTPGTSGVRLTLQGSNFRPGARVTVAPQSAVALPNSITVDNATVVNAGLITASVTVSSSAPAGIFALNVINADLTSTASNGSSKLLTVSAQSAPGAPLAITALALTSPRSGTLISEGGELFAEAILAGSGSGTVTGVWVWDGRVTEQFTTVLAGGNRALLRSQQSFPTTLLGIHTLELRVLQPNAIASRPLTVVVSPKEFKTERILGPEFGAFAARSAPPLLRWAPVPGAAKYQVGFAAQPYFSAVTTWYDANSNEWRVPAAIWDSLPDGEVYWTVRVVEMSGSTHKPLPLRMLKRFPGNALSAAAARPALTQDGGLVVDWQPLPGAHLYRITISEDAEGGAVLRRYLTSATQMDLQALRSGLTAHKTYYWRAEALDENGRVMFAGPAQSFEAPAGADPSEPRTKDQTLQKMPAISLRNVSHSVSAAEAVAEIHTLVNRLPAPDSTVNDAKPPVVAEFSQLPRRAKFAISVDGADVTALTQQADAKLTYAPAYPLANGEHTVAITMGRETSSWKFTVKARGAATRTPANNANDAEAAPAARPAVQDSARLTGTQMQSQVGMTTQWVSGSAADTNTITFGQQSSMQQGNWTLQTNGTGLLNSTFNPEAERHSLGAVNNYVVQTGYQTTRAGLMMRFGVLAPTLYQNSQLVTPATPRQGVEVNLQTPAGGMGFYANTNDIAPGSGGGAAFHQQLIGASWQLPVPKKYAEFRLMWLSAKDSGSPALVTTNVLGQNLTAASNLNTSGGGDVYGGLLIVHLPRQWNWISEYGWGYNTLNLGASPHHSFGRAWQSGVAGAVKSALVNVTYFDTGTNFVSPANPSLSAGSIPDRSGVNATLSLPTRLGTFTLGDQFVRASVNSSTAVEQTMNAVTEGWSRQLDPKTVLGATVHETLTTSGNVPLSLQTLPVETLNALKADQRDVGATLTASRLVGKVALSLSGSRDWNRNNLNTTADVITSSVLAGANWSYGSFFQMNSTMGVNWTAADKASVGTTRALTGHFQPALTWVRRGLQVTPIVAFNQSRTELIAGALSNNLTTGQYGGRVTWTMPGDFKFSSLAFEGDFNRNKNLITNLDSSDKVLFLVWTLTWNRQRGAQ